MIATTRVNALSCTRPVLYSITCRVTKVRPLRKEFMAEYKTLFKKIGDLTEKDRYEISSLYLSHFDGSDEKQVNSDLENKTEILLVFHENVLIGFTTLQLYDYQWQNSKIQIIYSGDTIVDKAHWGQQALAFAWIENLGKLRRERSDIPLYWFVIVKVTINVVAFVNLPLNYHGKTKRRHIVIPLHQ